MPDVTGIILCGGRGTRLGNVDKPLLNVGEHKIIDLIVERLQPQVQEIVLGCSDNAAKFTGLGFRSAIDARANVGPLAGIEAALAACKTSLCFICPGDAPQIGPDLVEILVAAIGTADIAFPHDGERDQHLFALIRQSSLPHLQSALDGGVRAVHTWITSLDHVRVDVADKKQFHNINTPEDLASLRSYR